MTRQFTWVELEAFLEEALTPGEMTEIESQLRDQPELVQQLRSILGRWDAGVHSLGAIWRRHRISCPDRDLLGSYLLGVSGAGTTGLHPVSSGAGRLPVLRRESGRS